MYKRLWPRVKPHLLLRTELSRFLLALLYLVGAGLICTVAIQESDARWYRYMQRTGQPDPALSDLILDRAKIGPTTIVDAVMLPLIVLTLIMLAWTARYATPGPVSACTKRYVAFRRLFWITGTLYFARSLVLSVTLLPSPVAGCQPKDTVGQSAADYIRRGILIIAGVGNTCTDLLFSGHTMFLCTCALNFRIYCPNRWIAYVAYLWAAAGMIVITLTHFHYTVDVVLAIFITLGAYAAYYSAVAHAIDRYRWVIEARRDSVEYWWGKHDLKYQAVAHTPRLFTAGLLRAVTWLDGIDLRFQRAYGELVNKAATSDSPDEEAAADTAQLTQPPMATRGDPRRDSDAPGMDTVVVNVHNDSSEKAAAAVDGFRDADIRAVDRNTNV